MGQHTDTVRELFRAFDRLEFDTMIQMASDDVQGIDEITRKWIRGKKGLLTYFEQLKSMGVSDIRTELSDLQETAVDNLAYVTGMLNQQYKAGGEQVRITSPLTIGLRKQISDWKVSLIHVVPLSEEHG